MICRSRPLSPRCSAQAWRYRRCSWRSGWSSSSQASSGSSSLPSRRHLTKIPAMPSCSSRAASNQRVRVSGRCDGLPQICARSFKSCGHWYTGSRRSRAWINSGRRCGWCWAHRLSSQRPASGCWCSHHRRVQHWRASSSWPVSLAWQASRYSRSISSGAWRCCSAIMAKKLVLPMPAWHSLTIRRWIKAGSSGNGRQVCRVTKLSNSNSGRVW
ncbi:hypothetical protein D3C76_1019310 [compost metagenome]